MMVWPSWPGEQVQPWILTICLPGIVWVGSGDQERSGRPHLPRAGAAPAATGEGLALAKSVEAKWP